MPAASKREQIVNKALTLFYRDGFNATGIDKICKEAEVSKKTLYNHFRSKDELVLATLRMRDESFRNNFMRDAEQIEKRPKQRLLVLFDVLGAWLKEEGFSGCMFINASAEFAAQDDPIHMISAEHKRLMRDYIRELAVAAKASDPEHLAAQLNLLLEGAIVEAHVSGNKDSAQLAKSIARSIIDNAFGPSTD